jgi:putative transposase
MSKPLRIEFPSALYHLGLRGNGRDNIYLTDDYRALFLSVLEQVCERFSWECHSYCLMTNHYHLMIETPDGNLSLGMHQLNGVYTQWLNKQHQRAGMVFKAEYWQWSSYRNMVGCRSIGYYLVSESSVHLQQKI